MTASPTIGEATIRLWNRLPSLAKSLIPSICALLIVLLPANLLISSRFYQITAENLRASHQSLLTQIGSTFDEFLSAQSLYLSSLTNREVIKNCAANGCADASESLFGAELKAHLKDADVYYTEIGFLNAAGLETARAQRGSGGQILTPGDATMFQADATALAQMQKASQVYVFPLSRDTRLSPTETYQQPALRFAAPVFVDNQLVGYVTAVLGLDNLFVQNFVPSDSQQIFLLDAGLCLLASSDDTRRPELYKTWSGAPDRTYYPDFPAQDWDVTVQAYRDSIISTRVIHGPLNQPWMLVVQQPVDLAYAQARALQTLLTAAHLITVIFVAALLIAADRAGKRLSAAHRNRLVTNARNMRFNPYLVDAPIQDKQLCFGRIEALAQVIGMGVLGGDDVLIVGDKRIGKTSVLRQVERRLRDQSVADPVYRYWPVVFSAQSTPAIAFYATLMEHILRDVEERALPADLRFRQHHEYYGIEDFRKDVSDLLSLPKIDGRSTRLVLCMDDVHCWLDEASGYTPGFRKAFRELFGDVGGGLKLIAAGHWSARQVFGDTLYEVPLGPLDTAEAARLIREPVADYYTFTDDAAESILEHSDLLPLEIQRLARHAVQVMLDQEGLSITRAQVNLAFKRAVADWEPAFRLLRYGGTDSAGSLVEHLSDLAYAALRDVATRDALIDPEYYTGERPILTRAQLDDIAFTDAQGHLRLKTVFKAWLAR
jgi:hypothetical protein